MAGSGKENTLYSPYGAHEMKAKYQRNFALGTASTVGFVLLILAGFAIVSAFQTKDSIYGAATVIKTVADLGPPPTVTKKPPQVKVEKPDVAMPKVGIPKPVADDELLDEDVVLASREDLAEIVAPDITAGGGDIEVDIGDDEFLPGMDDFVAVEIQPEMIHHVDPPYPRLARQAGLEGLVWVKALIGKDGSVLRAVVGKSSGIEVLDKAAVRVAKDNRFKPGIQNGRPVAVWVTYKVDFRLD